MLLDIVDNLPRLRLSSSQFRVILWLLKQCKVKNVPSFDAFRKVQSNLRTVAGSKPTPHKSSLGNVFFTNNVRDTVARVSLCCLQHHSPLTFLYWIQDFANPEVAKHLVFYPEETEGPISEAWQAERRKEFDPSQCTPMYVSGLRHFYIDEACKLVDARIVIPIAWIKWSGKLCANCRLVLTEGNVSTCAWWLVWWLKEW